MFSQSGLLCSSLLSGASPPYPHFFDAPVPAQGTDALGFACRRAGGRETFFFRIGTVLFGNSWASPAQTRVTFCTDKK